MKEVSRAIITDNEGKVLLGKRTHGVGGGLYALIGGKPDLGESAEDAVIREVNEEIGLKFAPVFYLEEIDLKSVPNSPWKVTYFTGLVSGDLKLKPSEVKDVIFVSRSDLEVRTDIAFNHRQILEEFFDQEK